MGIKLGNKVRDKVSGLEGVVIGRHEWLYGCIRLSVQPAGLHEGKPIDAVGLDEQQCDLIEDTKPVVSAAAEVRPGGPRDNPSRPSVPSRH